MRLTYGLIVSLTSVATVLAAVIAQRDVPLIINDLDALLVAVEYNLGNVTAYSGGRIDSQLEGLYYASTLVTSVLAKTLVDVEAAAAFSDIDSYNVLVAIAANYDQINLVLEGLQGKVRDIQNESRTLADHWILGEHVQHCWSD